MVGTTPVAERVRELVGACPPGTFVHTRDVVSACAPDAPRAAVDAAMHRLVGVLPLTRVRPGLYYKGKQTRFGVTAPDVLSAAYEVCKDQGFELGVGPAGYTAARLLGLTTQVPAREEVAVPGRCPQDLPAVHFTSRSGASRSGLRPSEVAVLEVLREWPRFAERGWAALVDAVADLVEHQQVRPGPLMVAARRERHVEARERAQQLMASLARRIPAAAAAV